MKKILAGILAAWLLLSLVGCGKDPLESPAADFSCEGMTITLTEGFKETEMEGYTVCYDSSGIAVFVLKEAFSLMEGMEDMTLDQYAELVHQANAARDPEPIAEVEGLTVMEYTFYNDTQNKTYSYFGAMFRSEDAFWLVQFSCFEDDYETYRPHMIKWAKSVRFDSTK